MLFKKKKDEEYRDYDDRVIIYDDEQHTATIHYVDEVKDGAVKVYGKNSIPLADCHVANGDLHGIVSRLYLYNAPTESIKTTENLAKLEQSIVLSQITDYTEPIDDTKGFDWVKAALFGLLGIAIILGMGSCGMGGI